MKIRQASIVTFFLLVTLHLNSQTSNKFNYKNRDSNKLEITGMIPGLKEGETVYLKVIEAGNFGGAIIDSSHVMNGRFYLQYNVQDGPRLFWIEFSKHSHIIATTFDNEKVTISYEKSIDSLHDVSVFKYLKISGSESADQFLYSNYALWYSWFLSKGKIDKTIRKFRDSILTKEKLIYLSALIKARDLVSESISQILISQPIHEIIPVFFNLIEIQFQRDSIFQGVYKALNDKIKNSYYGKLMKEQVYLCMGQPAPDFSFSSADETTTSLKDVIKKNKLTILHFWSNVSADRSRIHKELADAYKIYKLKGLEIVSISLDANKEKWKRIISADKIPGYQFCDFKEEDSPIGKLYKMSPTDTINIIIDQDGKMIAWDVDGPALFGYLYGVFGF